MTTTEKVLNFIVEYKRQHDGNSPKYKIIGEAIGVVKSAVKYHIDELEARGKLKRGESGLELHDGLWLYPPDVMVEKISPETEALIMNLKHAPSGEVN